MIVAMQELASEEQIQSVIERLVELGFEVHRSTGKVQTVLGAVGGATVNFVFMDHFQRVALGHFTIRRLERTYGPAIIRRHYETLAAQYADPGI